jgi:hypothetical protein
VLSRTNPSLRCTPNPFRFRTSVTPRILHYFGANKSCRIRTYRHPSCNPFRFRTYKNTGGGGLRWLGSSVPARPAGGAPACPDLVGVANPVVSYSCGLFVVPKQVKPFAIKQIQTLCAKHPAWGYLCTCAPLRFSRRMRQVAPLSPVPSTGAQASLVKRGRRCSFPCAGRKRARRAALLRHQLPTRPSPLLAAARVRLAPNGIRQ